jgi:outer membrane protein assembly factor BamD (BamD/ComL family)
MNKKQYKKAIRGFEHILFALGKFNDIAISNRGLAYLKIGDKRSACANFSMLKKMYPTHEGVKDIISKNCSKD